MYSDTVIWCSDYSPSSGEGILARKFLDQFLFYKKKHLTQVKTFNKKIFIKKRIIYKNVKYSNNFFHRYICIFFGAFYLLFNYKKKRLVYVNYLPLWNFLLFLILPKKTILGPITGGIYNGKVAGINSFIRKYIFPLFCKLSVIIINRKFNNIIFSTRLLESYYKKINNNKTNLLYDFIFIFLKIKKIKKIKKYDLIFYNRNHFTKKSKNFSTLINILSKKFTIAVVGDYYKNNEIINFGRVSRKKIYSLLLKSKFAFNGAENIFSLFAIDAINCGAKVFYNANIKILYKNNSNYLIPLNYNDLLSNLKLISSLLKKNLIIKDKKFNLFVDSQKKRIINYLSEYFY